MRNTIPAKLVGGPFDGDSGRLPAPIPTIWAFSCYEPRCPRGHHWALTHAEVPEGCKGAAYDLAEEDSPDEDGAYVYVYSELVDPVGALSAKEEELVPA